MTTSGQTKAMGEGPQPTRHTRKPLPSRARGSLAPHTLSGSPTFRRARAGPSPRTPCLDPQQSRASLADDLICSLHTNPRWGPWRPPRPPPLSQHHARHLCAPRSAPRRGRSRRTSPRRWRRMVVLENPKSVPQPRQRRPPPRCVRPPAPARRPQSPARRYTPGARSWRQLGRRSPRGVINQAPARASQRSAALARSLARVATATLVGRHARGRARRAVCARRAV